MDAFLVTCEHGGNRIPAPYRRLFRGQGTLLDSHRGYDPGALLMARALAAAFRAPLVTSNVSRLLVDLNRSIGHPQLFSAATCGAPPALRAEIVERHYRPYREEVEHLVRRLVSRGRRLTHISSHSFTPKLGGNLRRADVGLLYDPSRRREAGLCARWKASLEAIAPAFRVRRNYPYAGKDDGFMPYLRSRFRPAQYIGVELEINQALLAGTPRGRIELRAAIIKSLRVALASL